MEMMSALTPVQFSVRGSVGRLAVAAIFLATAVRLRRYANNLIRCSLDSVLV